MACVPILVLAAGCSQSHTSGGAQDDAGAGRGVTEWQAEQPPDAAAAQGMCSDVGQKALTQSRAFDVVRSLVDQVGPRLAGSPGDRAAVAWALRTLQANGFSNIRAEAVTVPHWERGEESGALTAPYPHPLALAALGGSVGTPAEGLEAEVIEVDSLDALDKLDPALVKDKIVFVHKKMERTRDISGYENAVAVRGRSASRAAKLGAAAVVIRSIGTGGARTPHTGGMRYQDGVPRIPAAALSIPDAELLHRILAEGKPVRLRMTLGARMLADAQSANVIGEIPGSEAPEQIVLLGAHLDSWDLGTGAVDDGAGCAIAIEAGRMLGELPKRPRRTLRVVLFANEENGLRGARAYAKAHEAEIDRHVVALESDLGAGRVFETRMLGDPAKKPVFLTIAKLLQPLGVQPSHEDASLGADLIPLRQLGVPLVDLEQDVSAYFDVHHTANDTLDKIDKAEIDQALATFAVAACAALDMKDDFGRVPQDKREDH